MIVLVIPSLIFLVFSIGLVGYHTSLIYRNQTTHENLKEYWKAYGINPYRRYALPTNPL